MVFFCQLWKEEVWIGRDKRERERGSEQILSCLMEERQANHASYFPDSMTISMHR